MSSCRRLTTAERQQLCSVLPWPLLKTLFGSGAFLTGGSCVRILLGKPIPFLLLGYLESDFFDEVKFDKVKCACLNPKLDLRKCKGKFVRHQLKQWLTHHQLPYVNERAVYHIRWKNPDWVSELRFAGFPENANFQRPTLCSVLDNMRFDIEQCVIWFPDAQHPAELQGPEQLWLGTSVLAERALRLHKVLAINANGVGTDHFAVGALHLEHLGLDVSLVHRLLTKTNSRILQRQQEVLFLDPWWCHLPWGTEEQLTPLPRFEPSRWILASEANPRHLGHVSQLRILDAVLERLVDSPGFKETATESFATSRRDLERAIERTAPLASRYLPRCSCLFFPLASLQSAPQSDFLGQPLTGQRRERKHSRPVGRLELFVDDVAAVSLSDVGFDITSLEERDVLVLHPHFCAHRLELQTPAGGQVVLRSDKGVTMLFDGMHVQRAEVKLLHFFPPALFPKLVVHTLLDRCLVTEVSELVCEFLGLVTSLDAQGLSLLVPDVPEPPVSLEWRVRVYSWGDLSPQETRFGLETFGGSPVHLFPHLALLSSKDSSRHNLLAWDPPTPAEAAQKPAGSLSVQQLKPGLTGALLSVSWGADFLLYDEKGRVQTKLDTRLGVGRQMNAGAVRQCAPNAQCVLLQYPYSVWLDKTRCRYLVFQDCDRLDEAVWEFVAQLTRAANADIHQLFLDPDILFLSLEKERMLLVHPTALSWYKPAQVVPPCTQARTKARTRRRETPGKDQKQRPKQQPPQWQPKKQQTLWLQVCSASLRAELAPLRTCFQDLNQIFWLVSRHGLFSLAPGGRLRLRTQGDFVGAATWYVDSRGRGKTVVALCPTPPESQRAPSSLVVRDDEESEESEETDEAESRLTSPAATRSDHETDVADD